MGAPKRSEAFTRLITYIKNMMAAEGSPAGEVMIVDDVVCVRISGELIGITLKSVQINLGNTEKKKVTKKKSVEKKPKGITEKKPTAKKSTTKKK